MADENAEFQPQRAAARPACPRPESAPASPQRTIDMDHRVHIRRALISVSDKTGVVEFAGALRQLGVEIISTGGTAELLAEAGVAVTTVEQVTGFPEMMDGRVKTLHPAVHGAILARRDDDRHVESMRAHGIDPIDLVCVNLYPFEETSRRDGASDDDVIEQIDIGGPTLLRSAAKNHQFVAVVTSPLDYPRVLHELLSHDTTTSLQLRRELAAAAYQRTCEYDAAISGWIAPGEGSDLPGELALTMRRRQLLRYGENPHQAAALYVDPTSHQASVATARVLHGKPLSYNNLHDASAALELVVDLHRASKDLWVAAIIKHTNPCGAAIADNGPGAFLRAYEGDSRAAFGGILAVNQVLDKRTAQQIAGDNRFFEVIVAPGYQFDALSVLGDRWANVRLLAVGNLTTEQSHDLVTKSIPGGMLAQHRDNAIPSPDDWTHVAGPKPTESLVRDAAFICTITKHLKSNAIAIGRDYQVLGIGCGQVDRVTACQLAVEKAGDRLTSDAPTIAASDAFFPFADGPQVLIDAGVTCIVQPGGSRRDQETIDACAQSDVTLLMTGVRHFRH